MTAQPWKSVVLNLLQQGHLDEETYLQELDETERGAFGTWETWSARDHLAHRLFWHQDLIERLTAVLQQQEISPREESDDQINAKVFEEQRLRPWSVLYAEYEQAHTRLIKLAEQLSEEDMTDSSRFAAVTEGNPLFTALIGGCYEHDQEHLAQYYLDHHNLPRAIEVREKCASRVVQADVPGWVKGWFLYNLAGFYAEQNLPEKAAARLQEALIQSPSLKENAESNPDLSALLA